MDLDANANNLLTKESKILMEQESFGVISFVVMDMWLMVKVVMITIF